MADLIEEPKIHTLSELIGNLSRQYRIPMYQRDYAWEDDQIDDFAADLFAAARSGSEHFFGTLVLSKNAPGPPYSGSDDVRYVIDGQQRLTTSLLMLTAVRHHLAEAGSGEGAGRLHGYLYLPGYNQDDRPKLYANRLNQAYLTAALTLEGGSEPLQLRYGALSDEEQTSSMRLRSAYQRLRRLLAEEALRPQKREPSEADHRIDVGDLTEDQLRMAMERLDRIGATLLQRALFIEITVRTWQDSFSVFEGLNNRGMDLSERDLVKNAVLAQGHRDDLSPEALVRLEERWDGVTRRIAETKFPRFLRHYLLLHHADVPLKRVVRTLTEHYCDAPADEIVTDLDRAAQAYERITRPAKEADPNVQSALRRFGALDADRSYPILLAGMLVGLPAADLVRLIRRVEVLYFRRSSVMGKDNKSIEADIRDIAAELYQAGSGGLPRALDALIELTPDDEEFHDQFVRRGGMKDSVARYMLASMENFLIEGQVKVVDFNVTLEHVMPKHPGPWRLNDEELDRHPQTHARLGNLTLLKGSANSSLGAKPFAEKVEHYKTENLAINEHLVDVPLWTSASVDRRQRWMADLACKVWPLGN